MPVMKATSLPLVLTRTPSTHSDCQPGGCSAHCRNSWEYLNLRMHASQGLMPHLGLLGPADACMHACMHVSLELLGSLHACMHACMHASAACHPAARPSAGECFNLHTGACNPIVHRRTCPLGVSSATSFCLYIFRTFWGYFTSADAKHACSTRRSIGSPLIVNGTFCFAAALLTACK